MASGTRWTILNLVKAEIDQALAQVQSDLESFLEHPAEERRINAMDLLRQVWGALHMLGLDWADKLVLWSREILQQFQGGITEADMPKAEAIGYALTILGCYLDYVQIKDMAWPQLLIPALNRLRGSIGQTLLGDDVFLRHAELQSGVAPARRTMRSVDRQYVLRRARQVYQMGLVGVLRDSDDPGHIMMMQMALKKIVLVAEQAETAELVVVVLAAVEALATGVAITMSRKKWLAQIERMLKALMLSQPPVAEQWLPTALYLAALGSAGSWVARVKLSYALAERFLDQERLTTEFDLMCGPGSSVIKTVSSVISEEMAQIRDSLDLMARGVSRMGETEPMDQQIRRLSRTLLMLGQHEISQRASYWADVVARWTGEPDEDDLNGLVDMLLGVENSMTRLLKEVTPGMYTPIINQNISIHQLDQARTMLVSESRSGLSIAKRGITSYLETDFATQHLENVPETLNSVAGGLAFLGVVRGAEVLKAVARYVAERLMKWQGEPPMHEMDLLADALTSVDYYLESLEANKPVGESLFILAEQSVAEMGLNL